MRVLSILLLTAALSAPVSMASAQTLPGAPAAFTLTAAQIAALLEQCRAGACAAGMQAIIEQARAAGISPAQLDAVIAQVASTLVEAARTEPALAVQVAAAVEVAASEASDDLAEDLAEIATLVAAGGADDINLEALAAAIEAGDVDVAEIVEVIDAIAADDDAGGDDAGDDDEELPPVTPPTGGDVGSDA